MKNLKVPMEDYLTLCKPRVVSLMLITAWVGMQLASSEPVSCKIWILGTLGIGLAAGSAAVINHFVDRHIDAKMARTETRPLPSGRVDPKKALVFSAMIGVLGLVILWFGINALTAILTFATLVGYAGFYTLFLKRATPQNIVIGGLAGATPPLLGWVAVSGDVTPSSLLLVLIIFTWTPPHFWALAIHRLEDYVKADIPMLPVTHGVPFTKLCILLYTILLVLVSILPYLTGMSGLLYLVGVSGLNVGFLRSVIRLYRSQQTKDALKTFHFSILYLLGLFLFLLADHFGRMYGHHP